MNDHELVRAAMRAADPSPTTDHGEADVALVVPIAGSDEVGAPESPHRTAPLRWLGATAAAVIAVVVALVVVVPRTDTTRDSLPGVASGGGPVDPWCLTQPLVEEPSSDTSSALRVYHTAQLAYALTSLEAAPDEILADATIVAEEIRRIHDELEAADWDPVGIDLTLSDDARNAQQAIDEFRSGTCP